ncbi:tumor susceptibility gene 101 protein-like isoform X2 [Gordionus sp. m RMFG-2023]|uniref:tumor susceptibility gene 101 protein-like isoform X2 n=1 Tax=Gordionus sp. m RMFG-2023 TaxID=3053472 RepID=UPI0031FC1D7B
MMINHTYTDSLVDSLKYKHPDRVKKDLQILQNNYKDLSPMTGTYVFKNFYGNKRELIKLNGTIPILYKGKTYNIPIRMWVPENYPNTSPDCFVTPTPNMLIKPSKYIDSDGKIYLPYFKDWKQACDLVGSIQVMQSVFGDHCPVFTKTTASSSIPSQQSSDHPSHLLPYTSNPSNLPYPLQSGMPKISTQQHTGHDYDLSSSYPSIRSPPLDKEAIRISLVSALKDRINNMLTETFERAQTEMDNLLKTEQRLKDGAIVIHNIMTVLDQENNEAKLKLKTLKEALEEGKRDSIKFLPTKIEDKNEMADDTKNNKLEKSDEEFAYLDETVNATTPIYKQLLNAYAEENAILDITFYLGESLKHKILTLDDFLKNIRELSRKQFKLKVLMQKCRLAAGLQI